jgi:UrcA family protein
MNPRVKTENRNNHVYTVARWLACALVACNAHAGDVRSETIRFADLNLGSPSGVEALYLRIHAAARRVCSQPAGELTSDRSCITKAESEAISKVNVPLLTAFYQHKTGTQPQAIIASR